MTDNKVVETENRVVSIIMIIAFLGLFVDVMFGLPPLLKPTVTCFAILAAVGGAFIKRPLWEILAWVGISFVLVFTFPR